MRIITYLKRKRRFLLFVLILLALNFLVWGIGFGLFERVQQPPNSNADQMV